jgi:hypothetical protein
VLLSPKHHHRARYYFAGKNEARKLTKMMDFRSIEWASLNGVEHRSRGDLARRDLNRISIAIKLSLPRFPVGRLK